MDTDVKRLIDESVSGFFNTAPMKMVEQGVRPQSYNICPHCKTEIYEKHEYTEDGGKTWRHSDCGGLISYPKDERIAEFADWVGQIKEELPIGGEEKYLKQQPGGEMSACNTTTATWRESANTNDFRIYNDTLCPALWDEQQHLDPLVRTGLLKMATDFYEKTGFKAPILDVYLMGSIANYNWTADSDADVHVIINYDQLQMPSETAGEVVKTAGAQWNAEHEAIVKGHKVELNIQNAKEQKPHVTGIYSLMTDQWIRQPQHQNRQFDTVTIQTQYKAMKRYLEAALRSGDREAMKAAKKYLDAYRQYGLDTGGELSIENIVFKIVRSKGLIKALRQAITATYDKEMSVKEVGMKDLHQSLPRRPSQYKFDDQGNLRLDKMTLDNLAALRAKVARSIQYIRHIEAHGGKINEDDLKRELAEFARITREIRRRMDYINEPVAVPEGYGAGDPSKDPKALGRWTVDFESSSKFPGAKKVNEARVYNPQFGDEFRTSTEYELTPDEIAALKNMSVRERQKFATMKLKQARRSKGQCISCGKPAIQKKDGSTGVYCKDHLEQFRNQRKALAKSRGSCTRCPNPPEPGKKLCKKCSDELELQRLSALSKNLCIRCKKAPMEPNEKGQPTLFCRDCMKTKVALNKRRKDFVKAWRDYGHDVEADAVARRLKSKGIEPKEEIGN